MTARGAVDPAAADVSADALARLHDDRPAGCDRADVAAALERMAADPDVADVLARLSAVDDRRAAVDDVEAAR